VDSGKVCRGGFADRGMTFAHSAESYKLASPPRRDEVSVRHPWPPSRASS